MYLISFKESQFAYTFVDYMATKGIVIRVEQDQEGNFQLFLDDEEPQKLELIQQALNAYIKNAYDQKYSQAAWQIGSQKIVKTHKSNNISNLFPRIVSTGPVTIAVTVICIVLYITLFIGGVGYLLTYFGYPSANNYYQFWRFITPIFIHFSLLHIVFNLMWWWYLGGMVEKRLNWLKLVEITLISGVLSNYAQAALAGPYFGGLSGVVYALMGYVWLYDEKGRNAIGIGLERAMIGIAVVWLIAGYFGLLGAMANTAHLIGLIVGLILAAKDIWILKK